MLLRYRPRGHKSRHLGGRPDHGPRGGEVRRRARPSHALDALHQTRLLLGPGRRRGAVGDKIPPAIDKIILVIVAAGDTPEERAALTQKRRPRWPSTAPRPTTPSSSTISAMSACAGPLRDCLRSATARSEALITDEILDQFAIVARWDDVAQRMIERYQGIAARLVIYPAWHRREVDPKILERWGEVARAVRKAG